MRFLAPGPPRIHAFVYPCASDEVRAFTASLEFLPLLLSAPIGSPDDIVASFVRQASAHHPEPREFLVEAGAGDRNPPGT